VNIGPKLADPAEIINVICRLADDSDLFFSGNDIDPLVKSVQLKMPVLFLHDVTVTF